MSASALVCTAFALSAVICALILLWFVRVYAKIRAGKKAVVVDEPSRHRSKCDALISGGLAVAAASVISFFICLWLCYSYSDFTIPDPSACAFAVLVALLLAATGFACDAPSFFRKRGFGLNAVRKNILQLLICLSIVAFIAVKRGFNTTIFIPIANVTANPEIFWYPLALLTAFTFIKGAEYTDGCDGLSALCALCPLAYIVFSGLFRQNGYAADTSILSSAVCGGLVAFCLFNRHPASVLPGKTGTLFVGGITVMLFFIQKSEALIPCACLVWLIEAVCVFIQYAVYKISGGKIRVFRTVPVHTVLEARGFGEQQVTLTGFLLSALFCTVAYIITRG